MKKFLFTVVLFCSATIMLSAEAIKDKDFEQWLKQCQEKPSYFLYCIDNDFWCNNRTTVNDLIDDFSYIKKLSTKNKFKVVQKTTSSCDNDAPYPMNIYYEIKKYSGGAVIKDIYNDEGERVSVKTLHSGAGIKYVLTISFENYCVSSTTSIYFEKDDYEWKIACINSKSE